MAASPRPPSWAIGHTEFNAGVLGETALPRICFCVPRTHFRAQSPDADRGRYGVETLTRATAGAGHAYACKWCQGHGEGLRLAGRGIGLEKNIIRANRLE